MAHIRIVHFVGFSDPVKYQRAVSLFGKPHYEHPRWDDWAKQEVDEGDLVIFADSHDYEKMKSEC